MEDIYSKMYARMYGDNDDLKEGSLENQKESKDDLIRRINHLNRTPKNLNLISCPKRFVYVLNDDKIYEYKITFDEDKNKNILNLFDSKTKSFEKTIKVIENFPFQNTGSIIAFVFSNDVVSLDDVVVIDSKDGITTYKLCYSCYDESPVKKALRNDDYDELKKCILTDLPLEKDGADEELLKLYFENCDWELVAIEDINELDNRLAAKKDSYLKNGNETLYNRMMFLYESIMMKAADNATLLKYIESHDVKLRLFDKNYSDADREKVKSEINFSQYLIGKKK